MASTETRILDDIISSRRALLVGGGAALAALGMPKPAHAALAVSSYADSDILNFALNLEYIEANFYYLAAFGTTIDVANTASSAAGAPVLGITGVAGGGAAGTVAYKVGPQVPFTNPIVKSYAIETAVEEGKHVGFLRSALGSLAVAQPAIDLRGGAGPFITPAGFSSQAPAWNTLAGAASLGASFDPVCKRQQLPARRVCV